MRTSFSSSSMMPAAISGRECRSRKPPRRRAFTTRAPLPNISAAPTESLPGNLPLRYAVKPVQIDTDALHRCDSHPALELEDDWASVVARCKVIHSQCGNDGVYQPDFRHACAFVSSQFGGFVVVGGSG